MKNKNFKYLEEFNRWCNGKFLFQIHDLPFTFNEYFYVLENTHGNTVFYNDGSIIIKYKGETTERFLNRLYGRDIHCLGKTYHFPSSFEELCIMNDLNGR